MTAKFLPKRKDHNCEDVVYAEMSYQKDVLTNLLDNDFLKNLLTKPNNSFYSNFLGENYR